jgi:protein phosphatase 2C family protein 2/3
LQSADKNIANNSLLADFRGPGVRHQFDESSDDYDLDLDHRTRNFGGRSGRIILLGDGTEVLTDSDDTEMFDRVEEDKDLESQVRKGPASEDDMARGEREGTPGPADDTPSTSGSTTSKTTESPSSMNTEFSENPAAKMKVAAETALHDKLTGLTSAK